MTVPSLRSHIADVIHVELWGADADVAHHDRVCPCFEEADALLADPTLAAIYDLAAIEAARLNRLSPEPSPEVRALLAAWRAER